MYVRMEVGGLLTRLCGHVCDKHTDSGGVLKTRREKKRSEGESGKWGMGRGQ